ncbi:c-type cytochrome [Oceanicella actignis]|uniref:c-type cytochrome n=1 Tax=Oceanicella actignis TaxID=1189325 RepID=UPI0011E7CE29|nr:cytochrome c [Oceanicella actignis]TYO91245.1 cytochrome c556 [Oceanicella actignis]
MRMITRLAVAAVAAGGMAAAALAANDSAPADLNDPVSVRQHMMKNVGGSMKLLAGMVKGEAPYDARVAEAAFRAMNNAALGLGAFFPPGSDAGETEASPKIWQDMAGFKAAIGAFARDTAAAAAARPADLDAFKPVFGKVAGNCKSCHEAWRVKKE